MNRDGRRMGTGGHHLSAERLPLTTSLTACCARPKGSVMDDVSILVLACT